MSKNWKSVKTNIITLMESREESMFYRKITKQLTTNLYIFNQKATSCLHSQ